MKSTNRVRQNRSSKTAQPQAPTVPPPAPPQVSIEQLMKDHELDKKMAEKVSRGWSVADLSRETGLSYEVIKNRVDTHNKTEVLSEFEDVKNEAVGIISMLLDEYLKIAEFAARYGWPDLKGCAFVAFSSHTQDRLQKSFDDVWENCHPRIRPH